LGIVEIIEDLGLNNTVALALMIIAAAVMITVILLMSYFNILVAIASFAYPNARIRAMGNPFVSKRRLTELMELSGIGEAAQEISKEGYGLPPNIEKTGLDEAERALELAQINYVKKVMASNPLSIKPLLEAFLVKYDAAQVKKALRAKKNGIPNEELKNKLIPVKEITPEIIDNILEASTIDEICNAVRSLKFGDTLVRVSGEYKDDIVALDLALDQFFFQELRLAITRVDTPVRETVTIYVGKLADITNLKHIIRSKQQGLDVATTERFLVEGGRVLASWKLRSMIEIKSVSELTAELEGTPYVETMRDALQKYSETKSLYELEHAFDQLMLQISMEIQSNALISAGPTVKFMVAKEFEIRNLKAVLRGMYEKLPAEKITPMLIVED
jgi:V/A-type H+-transporting ATPase subunit C